MQVVASYMDKVYGCSASDSTSEDCDTLSFQDRAVKGPGSDVVEMASQCIIIFNASSRKAFFWHSYRSPMSWNIFSQILVANTFFVDIVGLSRPRLRTQIQIKKINTLNNIITESWAFSNSPKESKFILPTGDGAAICFIGGVESPLDLALELHCKLNQYNEAIARETERIYVRIGIHAGPVIVLKDLVGNDSIWGSGIIMARRIMDIGEKNHILLSSDYVRLLKAVSEKWKDYKNMIHKIGYYSVKHDVSIMVYSVYSESIGNLSRPSNS